MTSSSQPQQQKGKTIKVLLAGDVNGKFDALFKRVSSVNSSNGPFDALLCVGSFFPDGTCPFMCVLMYTPITARSTLVAGPDDADLIPDQLAPYISGEKSAPIPTYFIGAYGLGSIKTRTALSSQDTTTANTISYLGRSGVTRIAGLQVAYLDGTYNTAAYAATATSTPQEGRRHFTSADVDDLSASIASAEGDIDFLLTNEWPSHVLDGVVGPPTVTPPPPGCQPCAHVAQTARPRYHIAGSSSANSGGIFYARPPYINKDLGAGPLVTRFISLGSVGNAAKQKWMHALAVVPACDMSSQDLSAIPPGSTPSPYERTTTKRGLQVDGNDGGELGAQAWRWSDQKRQKLARDQVPIAAPSLGRADIEKDRSRTAFVRNVPFRASEEEIVNFFSQAGTVEDVVRKTTAEGRLNSYCHIQFDSVASMERACQLNGTELMGRQLFIEPAAVQAPAGHDASDRRRPAGPAQPVSGCWFCLSNPNADTALVASVGEECYVAVDKGPISDLHVLILPVEHYACGLDTPATTAAEIDRYLSSLKSCFAAQGKELVAFERFMRLKKSGGNHCHINVLAIPPTSASRAEQTFASIAATHGFDFVKLPASLKGEEARSAAAKLIGNQEYFVAYLPDGSRLVHPIVYGERHPLNYGREVLAALAEVPERADWKVCQSESVAEEEARTTAFRNVFKEYDPSLV